MVRHAHPLLIPGRKLEVEMSCPFISVRKRLTFSFVWATAALSLGLATTAWAQIQQTDPCPGQIPYLPAAPEMGGEGVGEGLAAPDEGAEVPPATDFAAADTAATAPTSLAPNMLGDTAGGSITYSDGLVDAPGAGGLAVGRFRVAENTNPMPQDRVFFNYNHFQNVFALRNSNVFPEIQRDVSVDRFTFGVEKTFLNCMASVELRVPFASTLQHDLDINYMNHLTGAEFGDLTLNFKGLLWRGCRGAVSGGLGVTFPTGADSNVTLINNVLSIDNEAVHLHPYLGVLVTPTCRLFSELFIQVDIDTSGNDVYTQPLIVTPPPPTHHGTYQEQTMLFVDWSVGYWIYRACPTKGGCYASPGIVGIAPIIELHYNSTISQADRINLIGGTLTNEAGGVDLLNLTAGLEVETARCWHIRVAASAPLKRNPDRRYDAEFLLQVNRTF
jgi:hypothetical protein